MMWAINPGLVKIYVRIFWRNPWAIPPSGVDPKTGYRLEGSSVLSGWGPATDKDVREILFD